MAEDVVKQHKEIIEDPERLRVLKETELLDSESEEVFDRLTHLASKILKTPVSLMALVDKDRQYFKSFVGLKEAGVEVRETPMSYTLCQYTVAKGDSLAVEDTKKHPQMSTNLAVTELGVGAYLGVPITINSQNIGTLCVLDFKPRAWADDEIETLKSLVNSIFSELELRRQLRQNQQLLSKEKSILAELKEFNARLEKEVNERTSELLVSNKELQRSNRELQDFAYIASHDLQEPLRKISTFSDLLIEHKELPADTKQYLEIIQKASKRMSTLLTDLLTYSRVTTQAQPFEFLDLTLIVKQAVDDLEVRIEKSNANVKVENIGNAKGDPVQLTLLFQNLISNALKYQPDGSRPEIHIFSKETDKYQEIFVEDNGIGFDEQYLDRIFTIFQRLHGKDMYEGTGVGLAICKKIIDRHGGEITAKSVPDKGTTFIVRLPKRETGN